MVIDLDIYNQSFDECVDGSDIDDNLRYTRRRLVADLINKLNERERDWADTFQDLLRKSQQEACPSELINLRPFTESSFFKQTPKPPQRVQHATGPSNLSTIKEGFEPIPFESPKLPAPDSNKSRTIEPGKNLEKLKRSNKDFNDPSFSNYYAFKEFVRLQELLTQVRQQTSQIFDNPTLKPYKDQLNLFIKTQINSISNSDFQHLNTKIILLGNLFSGKTVEFRNFNINASQHPNGQLFSMDFAAQTFVTVGPKLVNSVPAIAKSMAYVINKIADEYPMFFELVIGHIQERCPFIVPYYPEISDFPDDANQATSYKIATGYIIDPKTKKFEDSEKYLARMRSMGLIYSCILSESKVHLSWSWLASFLSLYPEPSITATILQAFLQESSKKMSECYGRQYQKILVFIKSKYMKMIEEVSPDASSKQPMIKLENLLSEL